VTKQISTLQQRHQAKAQSDPAAVRQSGGGSGGGTGAVASTAAVSAITSKFESHISELTTQLEGVRRVAEESAKREGELRWVGGCGGEGGGL